MDQFSAWLLFYDRTFYLSRRRQMERKRRWVPFCFHLSLPRQIILEKVCYIYRMKGQGNYSGREADELPCGKIRQVKPARGTPDALKEEHCV